MDWASYARTCVAYIVGGAVGMAQVAHNDNYPVAIGGGVLCALLLTIRKKRGHP